MTRIALTAAVLLAGFVGQVAANDASEIEAIKADITKFWAGLASGELQADAFAGEQIVAYSSGGMWEHLSGAELVASLTEGPRLVTKGYHINVRLHGEAKDVAYASYYLGGKITHNGEVVVANYRTRVSQVLEKKGDKWVFAATHASPLFGGSGFVVD